MFPSLTPKLLPVLKNASVKRGAIFGGILLTALFAFEIFNFSTTSFALNDVLGDLTFASLRWSTILAVAFCGIDFAGIARIFTPEQGRDEPAEVYYLFGAWALAAGFNATLTWWGISVAIMNHSAAGGVLIGREMMTKIVPVFVAVMVWLVRLLLIGTFSIAGDRLFTLADSYAPMRTQSYSPLQTRSNLPAAQYARPAPKSTSTYNEPRPAPTYEPTYHSIGVTARSNNTDQSVRR